MQLLEVKDTPEKFNQVYQESGSFDCVLCCIATATNRTLEEVKRFALEKELIDKDFTGITNAQEQALLFLLKIDYIEYVTSQILHGSVYLVTVPSLTRPGALHRILIDTRFHPLIVHDSNKNLETSYASKSIVDFSYSEVTELINFRQSYTYNLE